MADNLSVLESSDALAKPVRTIDISGVQYPVYILADASGVPYESLDGAINVNQIDITTGVVNELFHRHTGIATTVRVAVVAGDTSVDVVSAGGFSAGDYLAITGVNTEPTLPVITGIAGTVLTLDRPLDMSMAIGSSVLATAIDMNVVGSLASPIVFSIEPNSTEHWHIISFILGATFSSDTDDSKFGNLAALTNGCTLRNYNGTTGVYQTLTNWKTNSDIKLDMYDLPYTSKSGGGKFGMNGNGDIKNRTGSAPHINGALGDKLELWIQDDLSSLTTFRLKAQGHREVA